MSQLVYINELFCWSRSDFTDWDRLLCGKNLVLIMPYQGWTPPLVVGDASRFFEIYTGIDVLPKLCFSSRKGYILKEDKQFKIMAGLILLGTQYSAESAVAALLRWNEDSMPFRPDAVYRKPDGRFPEIFEDPESVAIAICGWRNYQRNKFVLAPVTEEGNRNAGQLMYHSCFRRYREQEKTDMAFRRDDAKFNYKTELIEFRTEEFPDGDYRHDSWLYVLDKSCAETPAAVEYFKQQAMEIAEAFGVEAVFVKEKEQCYALGCCHDDFFGMFDHGFVQQIPNYGEKIILQNTEVFPALFEFLTKWKNYSFVLTRSEVPHRCKEVNFVEEKLPGITGIINSISAACRHASLKRPYLQSQWRRYRRTESL